MFGEFIIIPFKINNLHIASHNGYSNVIGLPNLRGLGGPAPVHLVLAQQPDCLHKHHLDVVYDELSDKNTGPLGFVLDIQTFCTGYMAQTGIENTIHAWPLLGPAMIGFHDLLADQILGLLPGLACCQVGWQFSRLKEMRVGWLAG